MLFGETIRKEAPEILVSEKIRNRRREADKGT